MILPARLPALIACLGLLGAGACSNPEKTARYLIDPPATPGQVTNRLGETQSAKIAWISPMTQRRLLVSRRGVRVLAASIAQLALLAHEARLTGVDERAAVDEAMAQVRERLQSGVSLH